jgi:GGDEF domain-containing protein
MASRCPEIPRARSRILFFALLSAVCAALGWWPATGVACLGLAGGFISLPVAHSRGRRLALSFVTLDWLFMGLLWVITGGASSPLLYALPVLLAVHLIPTPRADWAYATAPMLAGVAVLFIGAGDVAGGRWFLCAKLAGLTAAGFLPLLLRRRRDRRLDEARAADSPAARAPDHRRHRIPVVAPKPGVDPTTGLPGLPRVSDTLTGMIREAAAAHEALGIVCVCLQRWTDVRELQGELAAEAAAAAAARHVRRHLRARDEAFRVRGDTFLLALRDRTTSQAERVAAELGAELAAHRLERTGETLRAICGVSSYPAQRSVEDLLRNAALAAETPDQMASADSR